MAYHLLQVEIDWGLPEELSRAEAQPLKRWMDLYPKDCCLKEAVQICRARGNSDL